MIAKAMDTLHNTQALGKSGLGEEDERGRGGGGRGTSLAALPIIRLHTTHLAKTPCFV